jgi:hypothetical protein
VAGLPTVILTCNGSSSCAFFAGLTVEETAHVLGRSPRTRQAGMAIAKAWPYRALHSDG